MNKYTSNHWNLKIWRNSRNIRKEIRNPDKVPEKKIIISYLINKLSNMRRNMVQITKIWRFEKIDQKKKNFKLRSFAHEVKKDISGHFRILFKCSWNLYILCALKCRIIKFRIIYDRWRRENKSASLGPQKNQNKIG